MKQVERRNPYYDELCRIVGQLERFVPLPLSTVPADSMVREFTGLSFC